MVAHQLQWLSLALLVDISLFICFAVSFLTRSPSYNVHPWRQDPVVLDAQRRGT